MNLSLGINAQENQTSSLSSQYRGFPSAALHTIGHAKGDRGKPSGADNKTRLMGIFISGNYSWDNIILGDVSIRFDGSSSLVPIHSGGSFWSVGGGINVHNLKFMKALRGLINLKFAEPMVLPVR